MASKQELAIIYAALILEDDSVPITVDKVNKLLQAANVQVEPFWPGLYVKALEGVNVSELITNVSNSIASGPAPTAASSGGAAAPESAAPTKEEKKDEPKEESDEARHGLRLV
ncbi:Protein CBR-RLA-1 [Aphelenchoides bicaudatus]|nr:Protein CBR-RLA-1 [Aphelenchoides bicaudatus]